MEQTYITRPAADNKRTPESKNENEASFGSMQLSAASSGADSSGKNDLESALKSRIGLGDTAISRQLDIVSSLEHRSGIDLSDTAVHFDSSKPAQIGAHAYAQGNSVYIGPGQERFLGHELTHVVQQKQGIVQSDSTIGGLPVNTSEALEHAADAMSVTSAPETGFVGSGVVQGVFISPSGNRESKQTVAHIEEVLNGSLNSVVSEMESQSDTDLPEKRAILKKVPKARKNIHSKLQKMHKSSTEYDMGSAISECMDDFYGSLGLNQNQSLGVMKLVASSGNQRATQDVFAQDRSIKDKREGLELSMSGFQLPQTAYAGVENIGEYSTEDKFSELTEGRMGNSATLAAELANSPEAAAKRERSMQQFNNGAETARKGASAIKESDDNVSYESLMGLFSDINRQVRGNESGSGELRAKKVAAGNMVGVGHAALPEDTYVTFSHIADQIKQIKRIPDKNLQKSQAIYLAAFAYQMTISEHMFADGNGRTCRLFSDSILQAFGLPPSTPVKELAKSGKQMGSGQFDFGAGAGYFLAGVQGSDATAKEKRAAQQVGENTSKETMSYRSDEIGALAASNAEYDPTSSDQQQMDLGMRRLYEKIKHPDPDEDPAVTSARKRQFAQARAAQLNAQLAPAGNVPAGNAPAQNARNKKWWQFWK